jgi:hypothetical protein
MYITVEANDIMMFVCYCYPPTIHPPLSTCHELHDKYFYIIKNFPLKFDPQKRKNFSHSRRAENIVENFKIRKGHKMIFCMFSTTSSIGLNQLGVIAKYFVSHSTPHSSPETQNNISECSTPTILCLNTCFWQN